eukprot:gene5145-3695_t
MEGKKNKKQLKSFGKNRREIKTKTTVLDEEGHWVGPSQNHQNELRQRENKLFTRYYGELQRLGDVALATPGAAPGTNDAAWAAEMALFRQPLPTTVWINDADPLAGEVVRYFESLAPGLVERIAWYPIPGMAWRILADKTEFRKREDMQAVRQFLIQQTALGTISRQEEVSMIPPFLLDIQPTDVCLDMCASPGSKTAQMLVALGRHKLQRAGSSSSGPASFPYDFLSDGLVIANELDTKRANMLVHQVKRLRLLFPFALFTNHDARFFPDLELQARSGGGVETLRFDKILCDVVCSGDGTLRKAPQYFKIWNPREAMNLQKLQIQIAMRAAHLLRVGGRLVYSTCSLNPVENEAVVAQIIHRTGGAMRLVDARALLPNLRCAPGMKKWLVTDTKGEPLAGPAGNMHEALFPPGTPGGYASPAVDAADLSLCMRLFPTHCSGGGFFVAVLDKVSEFRFQRREEASDPHGLLAAQERKRDGTERDHEAEQADSSEPPRKKPRLVPPQFLSVPTAVQEEISSFFAMQEFPMENVMIRAATGERELRITPGSVCNFLSSTAARVLRHKTDALLIVSGGLRLFAHESLTKTWRIACEAASLFPYYLRDSPRTVHVSLRFVETIMNAPGNQKRIPFDDVKEAYPEITEKVMALPLGPLFLVVHGVRTAADGLFYTVGLRARACFQLLVDHEDLEGVRLRLAKRTTTIFVNGPCTEDLLPPHPPAFSVTGTNPAPSERNVTKAMYLCVLPFSVFSFTMDGCDHPVCRVGVRITTGALPRDHCIEPMDCSEENSTTGLPIETENAHINPEINDSDEYPPATIPTEIKYLEKNTEFTLHKLPLQRQIQVMASEFTELEKKSVEGMKVNFQTSLNCMQLNRYSNIFANEETLFPPLPTSGEPLYINGNTMDLGLDRVFVACQAPVPNGFPFFYETLIKYGITLIIMITKEVESNVLKANPYWPPENTQRDNPFKVKHSLGNYVLWKDADASGTPSYRADKDLQLMYRAFNVQREEEWSKNAAAHRVQMIQYVGWPDHGVPASVDSFQRLIQMIGHHSTNAPVMVHCSAGVGRTATLIGCYAGMHRIRRGEFKDGTVKELVWQMRQMRYASVQRVEQYMFIYQTLMHFMGIDVSQLSSEISRRAAENSIRSVSLLLEQTVATNNSTRSLVDGRGGHLQRERLDLAVMEPSAVSRLPLGSSLVTLSSHALHRYSAFSPSTFYSKLFTSTQPHHLNLRLVMSQPQNYQGYPPQQGGGYQGNYQNSYPPQQQYGGQGYPPQYGVKGTHRSSSTGVKGTHRSTGKPQEYAYAAPVSGNNSSVQYPQAEPHFPDLSADPVEGTALYPNSGPSGTQNPHLQRFVKKGWKDVWAGVLFLCFFIMTFVWGIVNMVTYKEPSVQFTDKTFMGIDEPYLLLGAIILSSFAFAVATSCIAVILMTCFPKGMIYMANILSILLMIAGAVLCFLYINIITGILMSILALLNLLWFYFARRRIPFAAAVMRASTRVLSRYKAIFGLKILMLIVVIVFSIFWSFALIRSMDHAEQDTFTGFDTFVVLLFVFTFYWVMQVLPNVMLVTTSGVTATWYFVGFDNMPQNPTLKSFRRATTTSFGSICFGSLIVAVIQFLRWLAESASRNGEGGFLACCLVCLLSCLEGMAQYFNTYAYVHIAMYGYGYISAAKHTFQLFKQCLFAALFNDCLINPTLNILTLAFSLVIAAVFGLAFWSVSIGLFAFLISVVVHSLFLTAVSSASVTIFVCFAEVPEALRVTDPELYDVFQAADRGGTNNNAPPRQ